MVTETSEGPLSAVVSRLRSAASDLARVEVKAAAGGLPSSLWSTVSAFANTTGGVIILGLDESSGFTPAPGFEASRIRDSFVSGLATKVSPRPTTLVDIYEVDGQPVLVVEVEELPAHEKPCYVVAQGKERGSYRRNGDGDYRMSTYEVFLHSVNVRQPDDDVVAVDGATMDDLDPELVGSLLARLRRQGRRAVEGVDDEEALRRLNVLDRSESKATPTVAGLLALGQYPQAVYPQWMVSVSVFPGATKDAIVDDLRMLDQATIDGPVPLMVERSVAVIVRNLRNVVWSRGVGAEAAPEIPIDVLREAVTNALTHRDYSPFVRGEQVLVDVFPDRVEVTNPGGIWGGRTERDLLDGVSRSRNEKLALLLQDVPLPEGQGVVCENRGSGIRRMFGLMRRQGLAVPSFTDRTTSFVVRLDRHGLLDPETRDWLDAVGAGELSSHQQCTLALASRGGHLDDQVLRHQLAIDTRDAQQLLASLVRGEWLVNPVRRGGSYRLGKRILETQLPLFDVQAVDSKPEGMSADSALLAVFGAGEELDVHDIARRAQLSTIYTRRRLSVLVDQGQLVATAPPTSHNRRYRLPEPSSGSPT